MTPASPTAQLSTPARETRIRLIAEGVVASYIHDISSDDRRRRRRCLLDVIPLPEEVTPG